MNFVLHSMRKIVYTFVLLAVSLLQSNSIAQTPESELSTIRLGQFWVGVTANGAKGTFTYGTSFFPNDYNVMADRGTGADAYGGMGLIFTATDWRRSPDTTLYRVAIYGPTNTFMPTGRVVVPLKSYSRYQYPQLTVDYAPFNFVYPGQIDPTQLTGGTYDQLVEVTSQHVFNVNVHRKVIGWSQSFNDNYVIVDMELNNVGTDTLNNFYVNMAEGNKYMQFSSTSHPTPPSGELPTSLAATWMHYYGGKVGDSLRVFYEYNANTSTSGDNMGSPSNSQGGRLLYSQMTFYTILHASREPYYNSVDDVDDFAQPKVTYIGHALAFPSQAPPDDEFGDKNFYTIRGSYSDDFPMDTINCIPGTHHGINNDDIHASTYSAYRAGTSSATNDQKKYASFGPYTFYPGQKIRIVYASGVAGINLQLARMVGEKWVNQTLEDPPMPNPPSPAWDAEKGYLPANFVFPTNSENDHRKARWISLGIDSVFRSAYRAKWNFDHQYNIPPAPPAPTHLTITAIGGGISVKWKDAAAELLPNFAGYRIMRRLGVQDTTAFISVYNSGPDDKAEEHEFLDLNATIGAQYGYYVQAKEKIADDDMNADPTTRGKIMFSGRALIPTTTNSMTISKYPPQDDLSKIALVPNPYNISDPNINNYGWANSSQNYGLLFVGLPAVVTIRIYTENGDLVLEHVHNEISKSGLWKWDMVSRNQMIVSSGVYIVYFETPEGNSSYQKFVVVR